jgi:hypothetical protein
MGVIVSVYNTAVPKRSASQFPTTDIYIYIYILEGERIIKNGSGACNGDKN